MLELYQFQHSPFCLKVRLALKAKELAFRIVETTPGIGQIDVFRISGQRKLPVLKDEEKVFSDSSLIIQYLETITKEPRLFPQDPIKSSMAHLLENWADTTLAKAVQLELIKATALDSTLREALLPEEFPKSFNGLVKKIPCELLNGVTDVINPRESKALLTSLEKLATLVSSTEWLVGNSLSIADIAIAAQLSLLKFPSSSGPKLRGKGCPGFLDNPQLDPLFRWRDKLENEILETDPAIL